MSHAERFQAQGFDHIEQTLRECGGEVVQIG
jgi:hypothetical protein